MIVLSVTPVEANRDRPGQRHCLLARPEVPDTKQSTGCAGTRDGALVLFLFPNLNLPADQLGSSPRSSGSFYSTRQCCAARVCLFLFASGVQVRGALPRCLSAMEHGDEMINLMSVVDAESDVSDEGEKGRKERMSR